MANKKTYDRRRFLLHTTSYLGFGLATSPLHAMFSSVLGGMSNRAWAQAAGINPRNYIFIQQSGAPSRWMFDLFLSPYSTSDFVSNPMVTTRFTASEGRYTDSAYETVNLHGINAPWMWQFPVPKAGGGDRPLSDLLLNMMVIQGATTNNGGHGESQRFQFLPLGATQSTLALTADAANAPFAAINNGASSFRFLSKAQKTAQSIGTGGNMLTSLLSQFGRVGSTAYQTQKNQIKDALNIAMTQLNTLAKDGHPGAEAVVNNRKSAEQLIEIGVTGLDTAWNGLLAKYRDLISRALLTTGMNGINDMPVGTSGTRDARYAINGSENIISTSDLRDLVTTNSNISRMAENFAFAEYVVTKGLTTAVTVAPGSIGNLNRTGNSQGGMGNDQHGSGLFPNLLLSTLSYRAMGACLLELTDQLKASNMFNDTVVEVAGEFNRTPRMSMTGSDHGWKGRSSAFYCGAFNGPLVLGNIMAKEGNMNTWGAGGPVTELGRQLGLHDMIATQAHLLRVPPPITSAGSLVNLTTGGLVPVIEKSKIVV